MKLNPERFKMGQTYEEYVASVEKNADMFHKWFQESRIDPEDSDFFKGLDRTIHVVGIGEDWCPDVYTNLPVMARIAALNPRIVFRVFRRDRNHDLAVHYLFRGTAMAIPAFGFFDADFNEFGQWTGGRPKPAWDLIDQLGKDAARPKYKQFYEDTKGSVAAKEFRRIVEQGLRR